MLISLELSASIDVQVVCFVVTDDDVYVGSLEADRVPSSSVLMSRRVVVFGRAE